MSKKSFENLLNHLNELESNSDDLNLKNEAVSPVTIGWHISHSMFVMNTVALALMVSKPEEGKPSFGLKKRITFLRGKFPRGRARAPRSVSPKEEHLTEEYIAKRIKKTKRALSKLPDMDKKSFINHPIFGYLNLNEAIRFLELHTEHHLKIIRDILEAEKRS